jgi:hypothetical protein
MEEVAEVRGERVEADGARTSCDVVD